MRGPGFLTLLLVAWPAAAADTPPARGQATVSPNAEFLEFLGETAGEDEDFVWFMESAEAERALERIEQETSKEDDDE